MLGELGEQQRIVGRLDDDGDIGVVLRRGADHCRPADIDILDAIVEVGAARGRPLERIEIDHHKIDRLDVVGAHRLHMGGVVADREQTAMDGGMERLDAAVHHLGKAGHFRYVGDIEPGRDQRQPRAAGRNDLDAVIGERPRKLDQAGLVGNGNEGAGGAAQEFCHRLSHGLLLHALFYSVIAFERVRKRSVAHAAARQSGSLTKEVSAPSRARAAGCWCWQVPGRAWTAEISR